MFIEFPPGETDDTGKWIIWFRAFVHGKQIHCGISYQALRTRFGADVSDALPTFLTHRPRIEAYITTLIRQGRCEDEETIVLSARDLRKKVV